MLTAHQQQLLEYQLTAVPALPQRHFIGSQQAELWSPPDNGFTARMREVTRVVGNVALNANGAAFGADPVYWEQAFRLLREVNARRRPDATLTLHFVPYHPLVAPVVPEQWADVDRDDLTRFATCVNQITAALSAFNRAHNCSIRIETIYINAERLVMDRTADAFAPDGARAAPGEALSGQRAADWNALLVQRHNALVQLAARLVPRADVIQYARLGLDLLAGEDGAAPRLVIRSNYFPPGSAGFATTYMLYSLYDLRHTLETWRISRADAAGRGERSVPFVALGAGFDFRTRPIRNAIEATSGSWNYPLESDWLVGALLNRLTQGGVIGLYPDPFAPYAPAWLAHFIAYALGASGRPLAPLEAILPRTDSTCAVYWQTPPPVVAAGAPPAVSAAAAEAPSPAALARALDRLREAEAALGVQPVAAGAPAGRSEAQEDDAVDARARPKSRARPIPGRGAHRPAEQAEPDLAATVPGNAAPQPAGETESEK